MQLLSDRITQQRTTIHDEDENLAHQLAALEVVDVFSCQQRALARLCCGVCPIEQIWVAFLVSSVALGFTSPFVTVK